MRLQDSLSYISRLRLLQLHVVLSQVVIVIAFVSVAAEEEEEEEEVVVRM